MTLENLHFKTDYLSLDSEFYDITDPVPLDDPYLISFNPYAAELIGLDRSSAEDPRFVALLNGTFIPEGTRPFSMCYAGHQFGHYAPRLGDGRAINFGSINGWHLQTKGSGETLYARMSDGRAAIPGPRRLRRPPRGLPAHADQPGALRRVEWPTLALAQRGLGFLSFPRARSGRQPPHQLCARL